ncbi:unnamed protein product [Arabidopsis halleri]
MKGVSILMMRRDGFHQYFNPYARLISITLTYYWVIPPTSIKIWIQFQRVILQRHYHP